MRMPVRIAVTTLTLFLGVPMAATADDIPLSGDPEPGNLLGPEGGNLLGEQAGNLLGEQAGNLLGDTFGGPWEESFDAIEDAPGETMQVVRQVRDMVWP